MSGIYIKQEPLSPVASANCAPPQRSKRRVEPSVAMPRPLDNDVALRLKKEAAPRKRDRHAERLLGGQEVAVCNDANTEGACGAPIRKDRVSANHEKRERKEVHVDEVPKLKAAIKKYEATVGKLVHKLKSEQAAYQKSIHELQTTNENLREEVTSIRDTIYEITSQRDMEQDLVMKLKGDNSSLLAKNGQLEEDLSKMIQNIQHSDNVLEDMRQRFTERDQEMMNLATEKKYLGQQLDEMRRMSRSISGMDSFSPPDGRKGSGASSSSHEGGCCREGIMGWLFGHGRGSMSRMFILGFLLSVCVGYIFQNLNPAQASNPAECDYDIEMMAKM